MAKNKEYSEKGVREYYDKKGCHSCMDCKHCKCISAGKLSYEWCCKTNKSVWNDARFPYDNTKCKEFQSKYEQ